MTRSIYIVLFLTYCAVVIVIEYVECLSKLWQRLRLVLSRAPHSDLYGVFVQELEA